jgi:hypothetical protein
VSRNLLGFEGRRPLHNGPPGALLAVVALVMLGPACAPRHGAASFRVVSAAPDYLLRSPDSKSTPFPEVLGEYTRVDPGWVQLRPRMELRVENAYYREGAPKRGLENFLGTEIGRFRVQPDGTLRQISVPSSLPERPADQPPVEQLLAARKMRFPHHRYFYQVILNRGTGARTAILLSAASPEQLDLLTKQLFSTPESTCGDASIHCTVFPEACTVSLEMEIVVNGLPRTTLWGSAVRHIAAHPSYLELLRPHEGRLTPVDIDARDPNALRLPLLPGDRLTWR